VDSAGIEPASYKTNEQLLRVYLEFRVLISTPVSQPPCFGARQVSLLCLHHLPVKCTSHSRQNAVAQVAFDHAAQSRWQLPTLCNGLRGLLGYVSVCVIVRIYVGPLITRPEDHPGHAATCIISQSKPFEPV